MTVTPHRRIAVIGGGVSGVLTAVHLAKRDPGGVRVALYERASRQARGLAYNTNEPGHLLNVRASNMSAFPDDPGHFERWIAGEPGASALVVRTDAGDFVPRELYGHYLHNVLERSCLEGNGACIAIRRADVQMVRQADTEFVVVSGDGHEGQYDDVVLAMGNITDGFTTSGPVFRNPWVPSAVRDLDPQQPVLIQGTGLTMVDTVIALRRHGFSGPILALSRRGLLPKAHAAAPSRQPFGQADFDGMRLSQIVRHIRRDAETEMAAGGCWRSVVDSLRPATQAVWGGLSRADKARFLRHVRPFWDAHRHRIAPPIAAALERERWEGGLSILAGRLQRTMETSDGVEIAFTPRGGSTVRSVQAQRMIVATGIPDLGETRDALVRGLIEGGLARFDSLGLGLEVDAALRVIDRDGKPVDGLWALGPLARGVFWECTAVPDIRVQAAGLAQAIAGNTDFAKAIAVS